MTTQTQPVIDKKDRDELIDFSIRLGQSCWNVYCLSKAGFVRVFMLPNNTVRQLANELFQVGFTSRLLFYPPCGIAAPDAGTELDMGEKAWQEYLDTMEGEVVLDGSVYPDTPKVVLGHAKRFFLEGFRAGAIVVREIFNS